MVPAECLAAGNVVVDFGCGDGVLTLGVASRVEADVVGVDLYRTYQQLAGFTEKNLGTGDLPENLSFKQVELGKQLPFGDASADLVYSWSVFEHLADVKGTLAEFARITKPGATLFIQVEPLYYSPFGSHLQRLVEEPWAHLLRGEQEFLRLAASAQDRVPEAEKDTLYRTHAFEDVRKHLLSEYSGLNRMTASELISLVGASGFHIETSKLIRVEGLEPRADLVERYGLDVLLTNQVVIVATRS